MMEVENNLPVLKGSANQIYWANNVRKEIIENVREIVTGKTLSYRTKEESLEDKCLEKIEVALKTINESEYWIDIDKKYKITKTGGDFPAYYEAIAKEVLKETQNDNNGSGLNSADNADVYVCAKYDKLRGNGVGAYVIWFVVDGEKESIIKTFEGDMSASIIKFNAISEIFKICSKRQIKHLNLHYGYHKIEELCCGKMRLTNQEAKNMKVLYERLLEFCDVTFIEVDEKHLDENYRKATKLVFQTVYSVKC